jgi:hypothetical protein
VGDVKVDTVAVGDETVSGHHLGAVHVVVGGCGVLWESELWGMGIKVSLRLGENGKRGRWVLLFAFLRLPTVTLND